MSFEPVRAVSWTPGSNYGWLGITQVWMAEDYSGIDGKGLLETGDQCIQNMELDSSNQNRADWDEVGLELG